LSSPKTFHNAVDLTLWWRNSLVDGARYNDVLWPAWDTQIGRQREGERE